MRTTTIRLPVDLHETLEAEADEYDLSFSEYARRILRARDTNTDGEYVNTQPNTEANTSEYDDRIRALEERLTAVEEQLENTRPNTTPEYASTPANTEEDTSGMMSEDAIRRVISGEEVPGDRDRDDADADELTEEMERALAELDVPGRKATVEEARRDAIRWTWQRLREMGEAETQELANPAFDEFGEKTGYSEGSRYRGYGLWDNCVREALKELPGVVDPGARGHVWTFDE